MIKYQELYLNDRRICFLGNDKLLEKRKIGIFISRTIPLNIIIPAEDFLLSLSKLSFVLISGWHSPFERRILKILLSAGREAILLTSKGIKHQSLYKDYTQAINENKLLVASLSVEMKKVTLHNSVVRNEMIGGITNYNIFIYISNGGNLEILFNKLLNQNKPPMVFDHSANSVFLVKGIPIGMKNIKEILL